jgi:hypothetical protein
MASLEQLNKEIKRLLKDNRNLSEELTYYKNRCKFLKLIIEKFKGGIKRIIN